MTAMRAPKRATVHHAFGALAVALLVAAAPAARATSGAAEKANPAESGRNLQARAVTQPAPVVSPVVEACVDHHTDAEELHMAGKLLASREAMRQCAAEACPALLQRDCVDWLEQLQSQLPSVTFRVTVDGQSRSDSSVFIDGAPLLYPASGKAVELDPGKHSVRVLLPGLPAFEKEVVLRDGEQNRVLEVSLSSPRRTPSHELHRPVPAMTYVLGGLAVVGAVSGGLWSASSLSLRDELENTCAPSCPQERVDELRRHSLFADISWGVSALSFVGAGAFFLFRPELPVEVDVAWLPDGGGVGTLRLSTY